MDPFPGEARDSEESTFDDEVSDDGQIDQDAESHHMALMDALGSPGDSDGGFEGSGSAEHQSRGSASSMRDEPAVDVGASESGSTEVAVEKVKEPETIDEPSLRLVDLPPPGSVKESETVRRVRSELKMRRGQISALHISSSVDKIQALWKEYTRIASSHITALDQRYTVEAEQLKEHAESTAFDSLESVVSEMYEGRMRELESIVEERDQAIKRLEEAVRVAQEDTKSSSELVLSLQQQLEAARAEIRNAEKRARDISDRAAKSEKRRERALSKSGGSDVIGEIRDMYEQRVKDRDAELEELRAQIQSRDELLKKQEQRIASLSKRAQSAEERARSSSATLSAAPVGDAAPAPAAAAPLDTGGSAARRARASTVAALSAARDSEQGGAGRRASMSFSFKRKATADDLLGAAARETAPVSTGLARPRSMSAAVLARERGVEEQRRSDEEIRRQVFADVVSRGVRRTGDIPVKIEGEPAVGATMHAVLRTAFVRQSDVRTLVQWYRRKEGHSRFFRIEGATELEYRVSGDDLSSVIMVQCYPVNLRGREKASMSSDVVDDPVEVGGPLAEKINNAITLLGDDKCDFDVVDHATQRPLVLHLNMDKIKLREGKKTKFKESYNRDSKCSVLPHSACGFVLNLTRMQRFELVAQSEEERNVIIITVNSLAGRRQADGM